MKIINLEPVERHSPGCYGAKNDWHYRPNEKEKLLLPHETELEFGWPKIIAVAVCLVFWFLVAWLVQR